MANSGIYSLGVRTAGASEFTWVYGPSEMIKDRYLELKEALLAPTGWFEIEGWANSVDRVDRVLFFKMEDATEVLLGEF